MSDYIFYFLADLFELLGIVAFVAAVLVWLI